MHYALSDIHGCGSEFEELLEKIHFSDTDVLYIVGDIIDRGSENIKALRRIAEAKNMIPLLGNHELILLYFLSYLKNEGTREKIEAAMDAKTLHDFHFWMVNGGDTTMEELEKLSAEERTFYFDFIANMALEVRTQVNGQDFLLIHSIPSDFPGGKLTEDFDYTDRNKGEILFGRPGYLDEWKGKVKVIMGHTPTFTLKDELQGKILENGAMIDLDCGCAYGYTLAVYCLENGEVAYINRHTEASAQ